MTLEWVARAGLALWIVYAIAAEREGIINGRSAGLTALSLVSSAVMGTALVWAGWWT